MATHPEPVKPIEEPLAQLERELMTAYIAGAGENIEALVSRTDERARRLLADASLYATSRLSEVEARLHYLRSLRGEVERRQRAATTVRGNAGRVGFVLGAGC